MLLLDTNILIDCLRGHTAALEWMASLDEIPACSEVTRAEVLRGMRSPERRITEKLLATLRWISVDETVSRRAGEFGREHRRTHPELGVADLLIGATASVLDIELATTNTRDYPMFPRLAAPYSG